MVAVVVGNDTGSAMDAAIAEGKLEKSNMVPKTWDVLQQVPFPTLDPRLWTLDWTLDPNLQSLTRTLGSGLQLPNRRLGPVDPRSPSPEPFLSVAVHVSVLACGVWFGGATEDVCGLRGSVGRD